MLVGRPDCHRLAHFDAGFNVAKKHWDSLKQNQLTQKIWMQSYTLLYRAPGSSNTPTTTASGVDSTKQEAEEE